MSNREFIDNQKRKLLAQRESLEQVAATGEQASQTVELDQARVGRLSRMDALQEQAMSRERVRRRTLELKAIAEALTRIEKDEYGECIECGKPIPSARLEFTPAVALCLPCAELAEADNAP